MPTFNPTLMQYKHLSQKERDQMYALLQEGYKKSAIAKLLGRPESTIVREIKRNSSCLERRLNNSPKKTKHYLPDRAQTKYEQRRQQAKTVYPLKNPFIHSYYTHLHLTLGWSPEIISGKLKKDYAQKISQECIYQYIYSEQAKAKGYRLWEYLTQQRPKRRKHHGRKVKRTPIPNRIDISQRPAAVETRARLGDWEGDTIFGKGKGAALGTFNERKSRLIKIQKLSRKKAEEMQKAAIRTFQTIPPEFRLTMTLDNGPENTAHAVISQKTGLSIYFAHPYHSWERGSNEKGNGLIRRYFPKGTNFDDISEEKICLVQETINNRPMKCLSWKTPNEVYQEHLFQLLSNPNHKIALEI